jgi:aspartate carbamoyltransferase catalytic subunit
MGKYIISLLYISLFLPEQKYMQFYKVYETHENFQNNNVIIAGDLNFPLIIDSQYDILNYGPCYRILSIFAPLRSVFY